jgi:hypothetical protein
MEGDFFGLYAKFVDGVLDHLTTLYFMVAFHLRFPAPGKCEWPYPNHFTIT